jgi:7-keto-8-aminopelargonate synthetase-like enzyme
MMNSFSITSKIDRVITFGGKEFHYFSGTAYLGMGSLPEFEEMVRAGLHQYGPNYGASRFSNVHLAVYEEMETFFATQAGAERAILMSSGFLAGYVTAGTLKCISEEMWIAPGTHPAILPENIKVASDQTFEQFQEKCLETSHKIRGKTVAILANAVDPLKPAIHSFEWARKLSGQNTYYLLIDDSHAFGLVGKGIFGTYFQWKSLPVNLIISGSLGKALSIPAGVILGQSGFIQKIASDPKFIGASPPAPGYCQAFLSAQKLYADQQEKLQKNKEFFFSLTQHMEGWCFQKNFPVATAKTSGWAEKLKKKQFLISSFPYPNPQDTPLDRIILSAYHKEEDLRHLTEKIIAMSQI